MQGWIKVYRKMLDNPIVFKDAEYAAIWMYLLLNATHKEYPTVFKGEKIMLAPGQLITGRKSIATKLKISESKVERVLKWFENDQQIEQQTSNKNRLITIVNWGLYQNSEQQIEHETDSFRPPNDHETTTNKNVKNDKNEKNVRTNIYSSHFETFWKVYPRKKEKAKAYKAYNARLKDGFSEAELLCAAEAYAKECNDRQTDEKYIKLGATFLSSSTPFTDYLKKEGDENEQNEHRRQAADYYRKYFT